MLNPILQSIIANSGKSVVEPVALYDGEQLISDSFAALDASLGTLDSIRVAESMLKDENVNYAHVKQYLIQADLMLQGTFDLESIIDEENIDLEGIVSGLKAIRAKIMAAVDKMVTMVKGAILKFRTGFDGLDKEVDKIVALIDAGDIQLKDMNVLSNFKGSNQIGGIFIFNSKSKNTMDWLSDLGDIKHMQRTIELSSSYIVDNDAAKFRSDLDSTLKELAKTWGLVQVKHSYDAVAAGIPQLNQPLAQYFTTENLQGVASLWLWTDGMSISMKLKEHNFRDAYKISPLTEDQIKKAIAPINGAIKAGKGMSVSAETLSKEVRALKTTLDSKDADATLTTAHIKSVRASLNCYKVYSYDLPLYAARSISAYINWIKSSFK